MSIEILALGLLIAGQMIISVVLFLKGREQIVVTLADMELTIDNKIQATVDGIGELFGEIFEKPTVKKAFGIIGSQGGQATANKALTDKIATDVLSGPKFAGIKLIADGLGMNIEEYIETHGAVNTLGAIQSLGGMIPGFDLGSMLQGDMNLSVGHEANHRGDNPYRR